MTLARFAPIAALLYACAPGPSPSNNDAASLLADAAHEAALVDGSPDRDPPARDASPDVAAIESEPTIPSFSHPTLPGLCIADPTALGATATQTPPTRGFMRFATRVVMTDDLARPSFSEAFNGDATINFVTPRAGRWRVTARGENLGLLHAYRGCTGAPTTAVAPINGPSVTNELTLDLDSQRDERWFLTVDGCRAGQRCPVEIVAERVAPLDRCPSGCGPTESCMLDPRDPERALCYRGPTREELSTVTIRDFRFERDASGIALISGTLSGARSDFNATIPIFFTVDPRGYNRTGQHLGEITVRAGRIVASPQREIPAESSTVRLWLLGSDEDRFRYDTTPPPHAQGPITLWQRRREGEPCDRADLSTLCAPEHVCSEGTCRLVRASSFTAVVAYKDSSRNELRARVDGTLAGAIAPTLSFEWLDASNAVLLRQERSSYANPPWIVGEGNAFGATSFEQVAPSVARAATALRVIARTTPPLAMTVAVQNTDRAGPAEPCDYVRRSCADRLTCDRSACVPAVPPLCERAPFASVWAPTALDELVAQTSMSPTSESNAPPCGSISHGNASSAIEFVAPATAQYTFDASSIPSGGSPVILEELSYCTSVTCVSDNTPTITNRLWAGQRVRLRAWFSSRYQGAQIRVRATPSP